MSTVSRVARTAGSRSAIAERELVFSELARQSVNWPDRAETVTLVTARPYRVTVTDTVTESAVAQSRPPGSPRQYRSAPVAFVPVTMYSN